MTMNKAIKEKKGAPIWEICLWWLVRAFLVAGVVFDI